VSAVRLCPLLRTADHTCSKPAIFRLHRHTTYVDAVYCYRLSSVVCHSSELAKTAEPIKMPFGTIEDSGGPKKLCTGYGPDPPWEGTIWRGKEWPIVKYRDTLRWAVQKRLNQSRYHLGCGLTWAQVMGVQIPPREGAILKWKGWPIVKYRDALLWAVIKQLSWLKCHLGGGFWWAQGTIYIRWGWRYPWEETILKGKWAAPVKYSTLRVKKKSTIILSITSPNVDRFSNFFNDRFNSKYETKPSLTFPSHLTCVAELPCETSVSENSENLKHASLSTTNHKVV